ncbi:unnamed protein product [marine sediment metagenome]|uniref:Uncharacterized protein n=1 Tax=marine sediment metagenome TaxID=412755 RepID=X0T9B2_9ZZZZ
MILLTELGLAFAAGLLGHELRPVLRRDFEAGWFAIACYVTGVLIALPFVLLLFRDSRRGTADVIVSYLLAFLGVGGGVVAGHYLKPD